MNSTHGSTLSPPLDLPAPVEGAGRAAARPSGPKQRALRIFTRVAVGAFVVTGLIGLLHMPAAAPLLRMISPASVCPIMRGSPAQIDKGHALAAAAIRNSAVSDAPSRPALGFKLDATGHADLRAWASQNHVTCASIAGNENLQRCMDVPAAAVGQPSELGMLEELTFEFQASGQLVNVQTLRRHLSAEQAAHAAQVLEAKAAEALGEPSTLGGAATVSHLSHGLLSTYVAVHSFKDYRATVSATNLAETGYMVREEYLSAR